MADIQKYSEQTFESIKHINEYGQEFWYARELQEVLEYKQWRRFEEAVERAQIACEQSGNPVLTILPWSAKWFRSVLVQNVK